MKKFLDARLMLIISMAIFGTIGVFRRHIDISSGELALYRAILAFIFIGIFLLVTKNPIPFRKIKKQLLPLFFSGVAMAFNWILLFEAYNHTTVSAATLSYYFAPVIVTLLCPILYKERLTLIQIGCFIMSTAGIVLITGFEGGSLSESRHIKGIILGLCAACLYATVVLINKGIKGVDGIHRTFIQFLSAISVLLPYVIFTDGINIRSLDKRGILLLLVVGLVHTGITYCMYFSSLKELSGQKAAILSYIDPLVAVLCSVTILQESISGMQKIGGILILGFTLLNEIAPKKELKHERNHKKS